MTALKTYACGLLGSLLTLPVAAQEIVTRGFGGHEQLPGSRGHQPLRACATQLGGIIRGSLDLVADRV